MTSQLACSAARSTLVLALALVMSASLVSGQQSSPLQGQGTTPDGVTDVYFSAYLERLLKVDDIEYQVHLNLKRSPER